MRGTKLPLHERRALKIREFFEGEMKRDNAENLYALAEEPGLRVSTVDLVKTSPYHIATPESLNEAPHQMRAVLKTIA